MATKDTKELTAETTEGSEEEFECWCGARGTYEDLCNESGLESSCGGLGVLYCHCGGDICACHHHGEVECFGCPDCREEEDDDDFDYEP